jgi:hypothetical protein
MHIDRSIPNCSREMLACHTFHMFHVVVSVDPGQAEIDEVEIVTVGTGTHAKIVGFYVVVDDVSVMDVVDSVYHLVGQE